MARQENSFTSDLLQNQTIRTVLLGALFLATVGIIVLGYRGYKNYVAQKATSALIECTDRFDRLVARKEKKYASQELEDLMACFEKAYEEYSSTSLAPYYLAYKSSLQLLAGNPNEGIATLKTVVDLLDSADVLYAPFAVKLALVQISSGQPEYVAAGTALLENLANRSDNPYRDMALYYKGLYPFSEGDRKEAERVWNELVAMTNSSWAELARKKLAYEE